MFSLQTPFLLSDAASLNSFVHAIGTTFQNRYFSQVTRFHILCSETESVQIYLPEKTPNAEMTRNGDVAETMKAAAVVIDVNNIAIAERLKYYCRPC